MPTDDKRYPVIRRITAEGVWKSSGPVHLGGDDRFDSSTDMALARDSWRRYYIPGASQAGATRSFLARHNARQEEFASGEEEHVLATLYGETIDPRRKQPVYASLIVFHEAPHAGGPAAAVRDGVAIDPKNGNAVDQGKFNLEVLPAGTSFRIRAELRLYSELPKVITPEEARQWFRWMLESFREDGVRLGAKTRRGLGVGRVDKWSIREFDLADATHAIDWLAGPDPGFSGGRLISLDDLAPKALGSTGNRLSIQARFRIRRSLLVRGAPADENGPDTSQFAENGQHIVPGTSLAGIIRHRVERIANTLGDDGPRVCEELFGYANKQEREVQERAGRVSVRESVLRNGESRVQSRVVIDRFTGGSVEARLFDEAPFWGKSAADSHLAVRIDVDYPKPNERLLLLLAFKDLWLGDLPVGGEAGVGRGYLEGVDAEFRDTGTSLPPMTWKRDPADPARVSAAGASEWASYMGEI